MKKIVSLLIALTCCVLPIKYNAPQVVKTKALNIPLKVNYSHFNQNEQKQIDSVLSLSEAEPTLKAAQINKIQDSELFQYCIKQTLNIYYGDIQKYAQQLLVFKKNLSPAADAIVKNYEVAAKERAKGIENGYSPTEVIATLEPGTSVETIKSIGENLGKGYKILFDGTFNPSNDIPEIRKKSFEKIKNKDFGAIISVDVDLDKTTSQTIEELKEIECVESSSINAMIEEDDALASDFSNEPRLDDQDYLDQINIGDAWQAVYDSYVYQEVIVAVLDSGLEVDHEDISGNFYDVGTVDITKSGYPRLSTLDADMTDTTWHGTKVWGIIRAKPKNEIGITGMYNPVDSGYSRVIKVMAVKTRDDDGNRNTQNLVDAVTFAVEKGASVISMSFSDSNDNEAFHSILQNAYAADVTLVGAAGNHGSTAFRYPACYDEVIGVAAITENNVLCDFSNVNSKIDICAPGQNILTTDMNDDYNYYSGTSYSAPMVAGTVALMQSLYVHDTLNPDRVKSIIKNTAKGLLDSNINGYNINLLDTGAAVEYTRYLAMQQETFRIRSAVLSNSNKSKVKWYDFNFSSCDGFVIYRSMSASENYSAVATIARDTARWDGDDGCFYWYDSDSQSGNKYYYKVRAYTKYKTGKKYSNYTAVKSVTIP